ncbi:MAG TPA: hypothetical protein VF865_05985 [Acidobacteriaceae bacterium]
MALRSSLVLLALYGSGIVLTAQAPVRANNTQQPASTATTTSAPAAKPAPPSTTLQSSMDVLKQAIEEIRTDKWKASAAIKSEAQNNVASIQRDLESTLPPLLAAADAAPDSTAKMLPVFRNVDALYDVMLRLVAAGRLAAPADQMSALDQSLSQLSDSRRALGEQLQGNADVQEKQIVRLQAALKAIPPPTPPPPAPVCPSTPPKKKAKPAVKKPTPATTQNSTQPTH